MVGGKKIAMRCRNTGRILKRVWRCGNGRKIRKSIAMLTRTGKKTNAQCVVGDTNMCYSTNNDELQ